jgi:hypothetical protein
MPDHEDQWEAFWKSLALWACGAIIAIGGLAIGLWSKSLDDRLDGLSNGQRKQWEVLSERASLSPRLSELERKTEDQEERLRILEHHGNDRWKSR